MKVVIVTDYTPKRLLVCEYLSETEKLYKVKDTDKVEYFNRGYLRQVKKSDCIYCGIYTNKVKDIVDNCNTVHREYIKCLTKAREDFDFALAIQINALKKEEMQ